MNVDFKINMIGSVYIYNVLVDVLLAIKWLVLLLCSPIKISNKIAIGGYSSIVYCNQFKNCFISYDHHKDQ